MLLGERLKIKLTTKPLILLNNSWLN